MACHRQSLGQDDPAEKHERDQQVHRGPGENHDDPLPHRLAVVRSVDDLLGDLLVRVHPGDLHVAAERDRTDAVLGLAAAELDQHGPEEQREAFDAHADRLRGQEVAELVEDDQGGEAGEREQVGQHV